ncbi:ActR/PrrA/RegA family redox response regulator transcription factor [Glacieibacterium frigidum]|uniref:ActR/PrrA/RegA family redox response regulator transcription factor n=1 Tax=Glacieibacterium frigidum TaxID=2593303 RepID=A0A552UA18_9SPHN|nr:ActR/PrrA/RegA family redox response regulator transcription factor [Glacieibacterium frigidum]TRW15064.1 ActR/PrrA/RegA family redox response regulator transcription factor [Glacieibacterium frigidum]
MTNQLLLVDDDAPFRQRLQVTLERKGYTVHGAGSLAEARTLVAQVTPTHAVVDMRLGDGNGLDLVDELRGVSPEMRIVVLTGYGNLATAVAAVKAGAVDYLAKPADPDEIIRALEAEPGEKPAAPAEPMSADRVRWEHIQRVYELCERNVSETARRLKMHRRTLQRILAKRSPR